MKKIGVHVRHHLSPDLLGTLELLLDYLESCDKEVYIFPKTILHLGEKSKKYQHTSRAQDVDLLILMGGDGTILSQVQRFEEGDFDTPLFGINAGNLGFLSSVSLDQYQSALDNIFHKKYKEDGRSFLQGKVIRQNGEVQHFHALNECVFHYSGISRLQEMQVKIDGELLNTYKADGLIFSTPTGSTAYNLAAGGPILSPAIEGISLVPIAPSGFSQKPIVVPMNATLEVRVKDAMNLSLDGQKYICIDTTDTIEITKSPQCITFLRKESYNPFLHLRKKLSWGEI